jgi:hypothetical protein
MSGVLLWLRFLSCDWSRPLYALTSRFPVLPMPFRNLRCILHQHTTHNNPTATWHTSFIPPPPLRSTYLEPPTTCCLAPPLVRPAPVNNPGRVYITPCFLSHLTVFEDGTDTGFRNVGQLQFDAGEIPKRTYSILNFNFYFTYICIICLTPYLWLYFYVLYCVLHSILLLLSCIDCDMFYVPCAFVLCGTDGMK